MKNIYDVIIVGAGPAGLFAAYELITKNKELKNKMDKLYVELIHSEIGYKNKINLFIRYKLYYIYKIINKIYHFING